MGAKMPIAVVRVQNGSSRTAYVPFTELVQQVACSMTAPSLATFLTLVTGWRFAPRPTIRDLMTRN